MSLKNLDNLVKTGDLKLEPPIEGLEKLRCTIDVQINNFTKKTSEVSKTSEVWLQIFF
jgi:hypothetical protein